MKPRIRKKVRVALLLAALVAFFAGTYVATALLFESNTNLSLLARKVDSNFSATLSAAEASPLEVRKNYVRKHNGTLSWEQIEVVVTLDESQSMYSLSKSLQHGLDIPATTVREERRSRGALHKELQLSVYFDDLPIYQMLLRQKHIVSIPKEEVEEQRPKVALIVDDVGYDVRRALELLNLRRPMTISIFPQLKHSRHIAEVAHEMGYEIMLHLPMESGRHLRRNPGFISPDMNDKTLRWMLEKDFESIPHVAGVNNHQGSKMTCDRQAMMRVMTYLAEQNMYFIDSRTTSESVAYQVARSFGVRAAENDIFLDNEKNIEYIKGRLELLMEEAEHKGKAIGICHVHPATMQALQDMFSIMDERGIELVYASQLVN